MAEYHVGCGLAGIYAGTLKKNGYEWLHMSSVTQEALLAVAQYLLDHGVDYVIERGGKKYRMTIMEENDEHTD